MKTVKRSSDQARDGHSCVMRDRVRAASAMVVALVGSAACWRGLSQPFHSQPEPLRVVLSAPALALAAVYLLVATRCVWERLWLAPVAAYFAISVAKVFGPHLVTPIIGRLKITSLVLWLLALVVSIAFVVSAFGRRGARVGVPPQPAGFGRAGWKLLFRKRPLLIGAAYLTVALALDGGDLSRRNVLHPWNVVAVDAAFEIFLCAWAAALTEMAIRSIAHRFSQPRDQG